jgi:hypothetical protein
MAQGVFVERVSSERPIYGLSEQGNEAFHFLAPFGEVDRAVSYGVFLRVPESIHGVQSLNCLDIARTGAIDGGSVRPRRTESTPELCECSLLFGLVRRFESGCFNGFGQAKCAGRTVDGEWSNFGSPDLQTDLHGANCREGGHDQRKYRDADSPTELSSSVQTCIHGSWLHLPLVRR